MTEKTKQMYDVLCILCVCVTVCRYESLLCGLLIFFFSFSRISMANQCNHCGINLFGKQSLTRHKKICIKRCNECPSTFTSSKALTEHLDSLHSRCNVCRKDCLTYKKHQRHERSCKHKCRQCDATFTCGVGLQKHVQSCHTKPKTFTCSTCNKTFARDENRLLHQARCSESAVASTSGL